MAAAAEEGDVDEIRTVEENDGELRQERHVAANGINVTVECAIIKINRASSTTRASSSSPSSPRSSAAISFAPSARRHESVFGLAKESQALLDEGSATASRQL